MTRGLDPRVKPEGDGKRGCEGDRIKERKKSEDDGRERPDTRMTVERKTGCEGAEKRVRIF